MFSISYYELFDFFDLFFVFRDKMLLIYRRLRKGKENVIFLD